MSVALVSPAPTEPPSSAAVTTTPDNSPDNSPTRTPVHTEREKGWLRDIGKAEDIVWRFATKSEGWTPFDGGESEGMSLYYRSQTTRVLSGTFKHPTYTDKVYNIWKCSGYVDAPPAAVFQTLSRVADMNLWNSAVDKYGILQNLDDTTDVTWCQAVPTAQGVVTARDFVNIRRRTTRVVDEAYVIVSTGALHELAAEQKDVVRGWNGPSGFVMRSTPGRKDRTWCCWVMNADARGWLPRTVVDKVLPKVLAQWMRDLRAKMKS
jgi:hypothetical protein